MKEESIRNLNEAVEFAQFIKEANESNTINGGSGNPLNTKMYAKRNPDSIMRYYKEDVETREMMEILMSMIQDTIGINPSRTVLIRYSLRMCFDKFVKLMVTGKASGDMDRFMADLMVEREAMLAVKKI